MKPTRRGSATLVDLLDRILDKGLFIDADIIIHVGGVPLLGIKLKALLAGMETMLRYGVWRDWDEAQRLVGAKEREARRPPLVGGEQVLLEVPASVWQEDGAYRAWRPGCLSVTDRRLILFRRAPAEVLFQCFYGTVERVTLDSAVSTSGAEIAQLVVALPADRRVWLRSIRAEEVANLIWRSMATGGPAGGTLQKGVEDSE